jgi:lysylphosphatidylglycerol synthetase-like protein (DUF2156 family)
VTLFVEVPLGGRAIVVGDLTKARRRDLDVLARALGALEGPGVLVLAGGAPGAQAAVRRGRTRRRDPDGAGSRADGVSAAVEAFRRAEHRRIVVVGEGAGRLPARPDVEQAAAVELELRTASGPRRVLVEAEPVEGRAEPLVARLAAMAATGRHGLVSAGAARPELKPVDRGFVASCGPPTEASRRSRGAPRHSLGARRGHPGRAPGLPRWTTRRLSWLELEAGAELHARLFVGTPHAIRGRGRGGPRVVASFPGGPSLPPLGTEALELRRVRRLAAGAIGAAGLIDLASAVTPPLRARLHLLAGIVPLAVSQAAGALVALAGLALLVLAAGVRRGQRQAWTVAVGLLCVTAVAHLAKGVDVLAALVALAVAAFLVANRRSFSAGVDRRSLRRGLLGLAAGAAVAVGATTAAVEVSLLFDPDHAPLPVGRAVSAVAQRLVGVDTIPLPPRVNEFVSPSLLALGLGLAVGALVLAFRPVVERRVATAVPTPQRAKDIVRRHGRGTLDYFALRHDKAHFFVGDTVVAYGVYGGVCLVSPDPVGPEDERERAFSAFRRFADRRGLMVAVLGAGEDWLPVYRAFGMHDLYVGDEAVVDVQSFSLEGGRHKGLRQAVNRIARYGYTISFHDPARPEPGLAEAIADVMTKSRRGQMERGFSMTLGRIFDPEDEGLLLAVARDPRGRPVAFCQYVPAPAIKGYSLDLMRRDDGEHPNGLIDFVVVSTIRHLAAHGYSGLGLNFATMRAVLADEAGPALSARVERFVLRRLSGSMQIESLWRFNAKYDPTWLPRYAVYDAPEHAVPVAMAIARAESFWELPVVGRLIVAADQRRSRSCAAAS